MRVFLGGLIGLSIAACAAPDVQQPSPADTPQLPWTFEANAVDLRLKSCPEGIAFERAQSMPISVESISVGTSSDQERAMTGASFVGAWHLTSDEPNFGGLSGLGTMRSGSLLAVSDAGAFVWIGIDPDTGAPDGIGSISYMRGADGDFLSGKREGDSEGLVYKDGLALVSFERHHRIEAFDLEGCGAASLAASIADLPDVIDGKKVPDNKGPEALSLLSNGELRAGFEFRKSEGSPAGLILEDGSLGMLEYAGQPGAFLQTGADHTETIGAQLFRAYDPARGNRNLIYVYDDSARIAKIEIANPLPADNYEGIAIGTSPAGAQRLWVISDDNFNSARQRTLLLAFDID
ncbi:MAG: esterase-like activity of phytase family protein [Henriciella sp.]